MNRARETALIIAEALGVIVAVWFACIVIAAA